MDLRNVGILPQQYTVSQYRRSRFETSVTTDFTPNLHKAMEGK